MPLPLVALGAIGEIGYYHLQIISDPSNEALFYKTAPSDTSTYPALWNHNAEQETHTICQIDCQLLSVAFTKLKCVGGTAWPNVNSHRISASVDALGRI